MSNIENSEYQEYQPTFFTVPFFIFSLPGITLELIKFYEAIFQFWNKGRKCFLSNSELMKRSGYKSSSSISDAFQYFELHQAVQRVYRGNSRYLVNPAQIVEIESNDPKECSNSEPVDNSDGGSRHGERGVSPRREGGLATAIHNNKNLSFKNLNKEKELTNAHVDNSQTQDPKPISPFNPGPKTTCPDNVDAVLTDETKAICDQKQVDPDKIFKRFYLFCTEKELKRSDWHIAFKKWVERENTTRKPVSHQSEVKNTYANMKDWTQDRLDREREEEKNKTLESL